MYEVIKKGTEYEIFPERVITFFREVIIEQAVEHISKRKTEAHFLIGAYGLKDVPLNDGRKVNVWIEYNGKVLPMGMCDAGIHNVVIYDGDEIPDEVLDSYNKVKEAIK